MFRRLFWLVAGIAIGAWGTTKVNRAARRLTPEGLAETAAVRAVQLGGRLRQFADDVRAGMAEREAELDRTLSLPGQERHRRHPAVSGPAADQDHVHGYDQGLPGQRSGTAYDRKDEH